MQSFFKKREVNTINEYIKNIYAEGELREAATIRKNRIVQAEGKRKVEREVSFYNLEMILKHIIFLNEDIKFREEDIAFFIVILCTTLFVG